MTFLILLCILYWEQDGEVQYLTIDWNTAQTF